MGYEKRNLRVFLSSSMIEFRQERTAIQRELYRLDIPYFIFEKEGASGKDPATRFREAVQGASVYVGIFGKVCGAYTREEFNLARDNQISCHLYVQDMPDEERNQELQDFLKSLRGVSNVPSLSFFPSTENLVDQIIKDLWKWSDGLIGQVLQQQVPNESQLAQEINDHLPVLCDRDPQEIQFETQITAYFHQRSPRPLLLFLPGSVDEAHGLYVKRVQLSSLDTWMTKAGINGGKLIKPFLKSPCVMTSKDHIRNEIVGLLKERNNGSDQVILEHMKIQRTKALLLVVQILASECDGDPEKALRLLAEYWAAFPDTPDNHLVGMVVCLRDDQSVVEPQGMWQRWFSRNKTVPSSGEIFDRAIQQIQTLYHDPKTLRVERLPCLTSPKAADVRRWVEHDLVRAKIPFVSGKEIEAMFPDKNVGLPMEVLYDQLTQLIKKQAG